MIYVGKVLSNASTTGTSNEVTALGANNVSAIVNIKSGSGTFTARLEGSIDDVNWDIAATSGSVSASVVVSKPAINIYRKYRINVTAISGVHLDGYLAINGVERSDYTM